jgi:hypothetical protein
LPESAAIFGGAENFSSFDFLALLYLTRLSDPGAPLREGHGAAVPA